jgi:hypothetical protein
MMTPCDIGAAVSVATEWFVHLNGCELRSQPIRDRRIDSYVGITQRLLDDDSVDE